MRLAWTLPDVSPPVSRFDPFISSFSDSPRLAQPIRSIFERLFTVRFIPEPEDRAFLERAQTQETPLAQVTAAVLDAAESDRLFGVPLARRGIQPVYLRIVNRSSAPLRLHLVSIDPNYYTPLEAAGVNHFSIVKRFSAFGLIAWFFLPLLALVIPFKLIGVSRANRRMDELFRTAAFHLRPIPPGEAAEGFVFTRLDAGTKIVHVRVNAVGDVAAVAARYFDSGREIDSAALTAELAAAEAHGTADFTFSISVPGIKVDYHRRDFSAIEQQSPPVDCDLRALEQRLRTMPATTTNRKHTGTGDPVNLVVIGQFETILSAFAARWDESEIISLATCWKTFRAFLLGSDYRYSPVSALYLFGRSQDIALQRTRRSINERLHLRLWLTPLRFRGKPVWVGQVSRDIGVRFTFKTWNLTTHRVDSDVDESRDYVLEDLLVAERIDVAGYVDGVGQCSRESPRRNLTGDPYFTDGKRAVLLLSMEKATPRLVAWS